MIDWEHFAHVAYNTYANRKEWRDGDRKMVNFDRLPELERRAWIEAVKQGIDCYNESVREEDLWIANRMTIQKH